MKKRFLSRILSLIMDIAILCLSVSTVTFATTSSTSGTIGTDISWSISQDGTLTISGTGEMVIDGEVPWDESLDAIKRVAIENGITTIGEQAFRDCINLTDVTISDSVTKIGESAFYGCTSLASIVIPDSVKEVPRNALIGTAFYNNESNWTNNILYAGNHLVDTKNACEGEITVREGTLSIGQNSFNGDVTKIIIPNSVRYIGKYAFASLHELTKCDIPDSVTEMGEYVFNCCRALKEISIGIGLKEIPKGAFKESGLTAITIPQNITRIGEGAFSCTDLTNVTFTEGLKAIDGHAFEKTKLTQVSIPDSVTELGGLVFSGCTNLTDVVIGDGVETIGSSIFADCTLNSLTVGDKMTNESGNDLFYQMTSLEELIIGDGVTDLSDFYTSNATIKALVKSVKKITLGNGITQIEMDTFDGFTELTDITLGDNVTYIQKDAFVDTPFYNDANKWEDGVLYIGKYLIKANSSVTTCNIKNGTILIAAYAFGSSNGALTSVTVPDGVKYINNNAFAAESNLKNISLPDSIVEIGNYAFLSTGAHKTFKNGTEDMFYLGKHLIDVKAGCTDFSIKDDTITIAGKAFENVKSTLTEITIPNSVIYISDDAFRLCKALTKVTFGENIKTIGEEAFYSTGLTSVVIPSSVETIENMAFYGCKALASAEVNCKVIKDGAFSGCSALEVLHINEGVTIIGNSFSNCTSLERVRIPDSVTQIDMAFNGCTSLRKVVFGSGIKTYGNIFSNKCTNLKYIVIPKTDGVVFESFLTHSSGMPKEVYYMGSESDWKSIHGSERTKEDIIINYNATEPSEVWLNSIEGNGTEEPISITFECDNPSVGGNVIAVLLKDGVITDTVEIPAANLKEVEFEPGKTGTEVQVLWWESIGVMTPVTESVSKEI